ncbi:MAG: hypothetical protein HQK99_06935 [Nitrospirae bacterium]|nr:hypothetical protein [Nitrospirota bacterium]
MTETAPVAAVTTAAVTNPDIERINEILHKLSPERVKEIADFTAFLAEKERKHKAFVEETLAAEQRGEYLIFHTAEEFMDAILNADDD